MTSLSESCQSSPRSASPRRHDDSSQHSRNNSNFTTISNTPSTSADGNSIHGSFCSISPPLRWEATCQTSSSMPSRRLLLHAQSQGATPTTSDSVRATQMAITSSQLNAIQTTSSSSRSKTKESRYSRTWATLLGHQQTVQYSDGKHTDFAEKQNYHAQEHPARAMIEPLEIRIRVKRIPHSWTTWHLYSCFERFGTINRIDMYEPMILDRDATISFRPAPLDVSWIGGTVAGSGPDGVAQLQTSNISRPVSFWRSPNLPLRSYPERVTIPIKAVDFGVMQTASQMQILHSSRAHAELTCDFTVDIRERVMLITFPVPQAASNSTKNKFIQSQFKISIDMAQIKVIDVVRLDRSIVSLVFSVDSPPLVFRKTLNIEKTHATGAVSWDERSTWFRQTDVELNPRSRDTAIQLQKNACIIDTGRWLSYRLSLCQATFESPQLQDIFQALEDHNIQIRTNKNIVFMFSFFHEPTDMWQSLKHTVKGSSNSCLSDLHLMADEAAHLSFPVQYQLEVCLSLGVLQECNIQHSFIERLASMDPTRAVRLLEKIADDKHRYYEPEQILQAQARLSAVPKRRLGYCTKIPLAVVTPSTIYYATPVLETSNRVIRQFQHHEDRFLRVKFTDEKHRGKIMSSDDSSMNEIFSRINRVLMHGILIGDRHYEFLAFGSSQFREHGAYFFSSTNGCTAADIRHWMGDFTAIKIVAKYCSRLGQCFSTTRAIPHAVNIERIPDIKTADGKYTFTDGTGKLSPFLARMIANHFRMTNVSQHDCPSVFQFRLAGCKGVLAVDPALKGTTIQVRPSQEKFPAQYEGLEICRVAQFQAATLNMQLILVLSTLGVPDRIFVGKLRTMISDLSLAMTDREKACELLQRHIDYNQMTLRLSSMIRHGFMDSRDPFLVTCLRLWRSWNLKYLKEKARIFVECGAFVMGTTDETQTLRGHFNTSKDEDGNEALSEIFLQISDPLKDGNFKIITGICALARNPCLHPGDIRVVRAVDIPALRHHRNAVILPQTGDRDIANMCSGGDLDGDDYIVIWDKTLLPQEWNHEPMDYTTPGAVESVGLVGVKDMAKFFVNHIKNDNLGRIAVAHRYWADAPQNDHGVKHPHCMELATLHSMAVDYAKTGVPAKFPAHLRIRRWPHWSEQKNKHGHQIYHSKRILGKLYDEVKREPFQGAWELPFDSRILEKHNPTEQELCSASEIKTLYDEAVRRIMAQYGIKTEFEVATTFVLEHHQEIGDYKFSETIGEALNVLQEDFREMCYLKAGTTSTDRHWAKIKPFLIAMYTVTAHEVAAALAEIRESDGCDHQEVLANTIGFNDMPFISFPWLFARELGQIATDGDSEAHGTLSTLVSVSKSTVKRDDILLGDELTLQPLPEVTLAGSTVHDGDILDLFQDSISYESAALQPMRAEGANSIVTATDRQHNLEPISSKASISHGDPREGLAISRNVSHLSSFYCAAGLPSDVSLQEVNGSHMSSLVVPLSPKPTAQDFPAVVDSAEFQHGEDESEDECEEVLIELHDELTGLERLARLVGFKER